MSERSSSSDRDPSRPDTDDVAEVRVLDERRLPGLLDSAPVGSEMVVEWSFETVYRREYPGLVAVAAAMTGDREGAPDLVHDAMVRALTRWDRVSRLERPGAWCHHVLVNICRSRLRRRTTERRYMSRLRRHEPVAPEPSADTIAFWSIVRTLPSRPKSVVALYFGGELTSVEIAQVLGVPEGTVRSDLLVARRLVMRSLREDRDCHA